MKISPLLLMAWLSDVVFISLLIDDLYLLLLLFMVSALPAVFWGGKMWLTYIKYSLLSAGVIFLFNFLLGGFSSLTFSLSMSLRLLAIASAFGVFSSSTDMEDVIAIMESLRFPPKAVATLAISLRFFPVVVRDSKEIGEALAARGMAGGEGSRTSRIRARLPHLTSLIMVSLERGINLAEALELKGFPSSRRRPRILKIAGVDYFVVSFLILSAVLSTLSILLSSYLAGIVSVLLSLSILGGVHGD